MQQPPAQKRAEAPAADRMSFVYLGKGEEIVRKGAELSAFPGVKIFEIDKVITTSK